MYKARMKVEGRTPPPNNQGGKHPDDPNSKSCFRVPVVCRADNRADELRFCPAPDHILMTLPLNVVQVLIGSDVLEVSSTSKLVAYYDRNEWGARRMMPTTCTSGGTRKRSSPTATAQADSAITNTGIRLLGPVFLTTPLASSELAPPGKGVYYLRRLAWQTRLHAQRRKAKKLRICSHVPARALS